MTPTGDDSAQRNALQIEANQVAALISSSQLTKPRIKHAGCRLWASSCAQQRHVKL